jgi:hypothetical protein
VNTIKVSGTGQLPDRVRDLEQAVNYGEVVLPFPVIGEVEGGGGTQGPPGPAGPGVPAGGTAGQVLTKSSATDYATVWQDPAAVSGVSYRHVQASAATVWTITHNLAFRPNVTAVDSTGQVMLPGTVLYTSATTVQLTFSAAVGGEAYVS